MFDGAPTTLFDLWARSSINTHTEALAKHEAQLAESKSIIAESKSTIDAVKGELAASKSTIVALTAALAKVQATIDSIDDTCIDSSNRRRLSRCLDGESHTKPHTPTTPSFFILKGRRSSAAPRHSMLV